MRRRLIASNLLLITIVLLLLEIPLAAIYTRHEHDALDSSLQRDASSLAALSEEIIEHPGAHDVGSLAQRFTAGTGGEVIIVDRAGNRLTPAPAGDPNGFQTAIDATRTGQATTGEAEGLAYVAVPVGSASDSHGVVLVARSDAATEHRVHQFWLALAAIAIAVLAISAFVSRRLARWAVDPLQRLDDHAAELGRGALHRRVETNTGPPEIAALAHTFNEMADQLHQLVSSQRRFVADASHQLRAPLTALRLRLENLDANDADGVITTRDAALLEAARLTRIVDGLLALARADGQRPERQTVDVGEVVARRHEMWSPLAAEQRVDLLLDTNGDHAIRAMLVPGHLDQILDNLIDNALEATPAGRAVHLAARSTATAVEVHVIDEGPGMTAHDRQRAFDPFWQSTRQHANGTSGLGLAIVDQLVRASNGAVVLDRASSGGIDAAIRFSRGRSN
jgi:signal transduction histidine kinase